MKLLKNIAIFLIATFVFALPTSCLGQAGANNDESTLKFKTHEWNFGEVKEVEGAVRYTFSFTNEGKEAVVLESVSSSCGCATPEYSRKPILPNTVGTITVEFDPTGRPGPFMKSIYVRSRGGKNYDVLRITGQVMPRPRSVEEDYPYVLSNGLRINIQNLNFRYVAHGSGNAMVVGYANTSKKDISLGVIVDPVTPYLSIDAPKTICAGCRGDITLIYQLESESNQYGAVTSEVFFVVDGVKAKEPVKASAIFTDNFENVEMSKSPVLEIKPAFYHFGEVNARDKLSKEFTIENKGKAPLKIRSVEVRRGVTTTLEKDTEVKAGGSVSFRCDYTLPSNAKGVVTGSVVIISNDPSLPMRELRIAANVK